MLQDDRDNIETVEAERDDVEGSLRTEGGRVGKRIN